MSDKYGALSAPAGRVSVSWNVEGEGTEAALALAWSEAGGPPVEEPSRRGFGSRLVNMGLLGTGGAEIEYRSEGLHAVFRCLVADLQRPAG